MRRNNPLRDETKALQVVRRQIEEKMEQAQKQAFKSMDRLYSEDDVEDYHIRYLIDYLASWASLADSIGWLDEAITLIEKNVEDADTMLDQLKARIDWAYGGSPGHRRSYATSPLIAEIQSRFHDMEELMGQPLDYIFETAEYSDQFISSKDQFVFSYLHGSYSMRDLYWIIENLLAAIRSDDEFSYNKDGGLFNWRHETQALTIDNEDLANIRDDINSIITGRTYYGFRDTFDVSDLDSTKLIWSNGQASWVIANKFYENNLKNVLVRGLPATSGFMDANIIVVPYPPPVVKLILSSLYPLPLYTQSMEGKMRRRERGEQGPLVNDRVAKRLLTGLVIEGFKQRHPTYKKTLDADNSMVKWQLGSLWEVMLKAKASRDEDLFESTLKEFPMMPGEYGQLVNWFNSIEL